MSASAKTEPFDFVLPVEWARAKRTNDVPRERAVRLYKASPEHWELQVRAPIGVGGGYRDGKDFIVAWAGLKESDLVALRDAIDQHLAREREEL